MLGKHTLGANETIELKIIYHTTGRPGPFQKNIIVETNAQGQEEVILSMAGVVKEMPGAKIHVIPRKLDVGTIKGQSIVKLEYKVSNTGLKPLIINKIYSSERNVIYFEGTREGDMLLDPGKTENIILEYKPSGQGPFMERITLSSNARNASKGNYIIMVTGIVE